MTFWIIEPRDPLIVRDGRPFGPDPGARAATLRFPFPSTVVGALRHKAGLSANDGPFDRNVIATLLDQKMVGPLLVEPDDDDCIKAWLLPAPADALLLDSDEAHLGDVLCFRLAPQRHSAVTNVPDGLMPVGLAQHRPEKVRSDTPQFWYHTALAAWLRRPGDGPLALESLGIRGLEINTRAHVSIESAQQTARDGALFQTSGLEFTWRDPSAASNGAFVTKRLALAAWFDGETPHFAGGFAALGGERRLMRWSQVDATYEPFSSVDKAAIYAHVLQERRCRVLLLTPAHFADGYRPAQRWVRGGVMATLQAAVVPRYQTVSGWNMVGDNGTDSNGRRKPRGKPKPTRRLAPAGSVYFVEFADDVDIAAWLDHTWMQNVSDDAQACRDGFGLAAVGVWNTEQA